MKRFILFWALLVLFAAPAWAIDTNKYPHTLIDQTCTDSYNVPAAFTPSAVHVLGGPPQVIASQITQLSGTSDGFCDNDSRIITRDITADISIGPFSLPEWASGIILLVDVNAITGGSTDANFQFRYVRPHEAVESTYATTATISATGDLTYIVRPDPAAHAYSPSTAEIPIALGPGYLIRVNLISATLVTLNMSQLVLY